MSEFKHDIENAGLNHMLDNELSADPNVNYEILDYTVKQYYNLLKLSTYPM